MGEKENPATRRELTSKSSGARNGIEQCSAAKSCCKRATLRSGIGIRAGNADPKSIKIGVELSSASMMLACGQRKTCVMVQER